MGDFGSPPEHLMNDDLNEGIRRIKESERGHPQKGERDFLDSVREATTEDGSIDLLELDSHRTGRVNGGIACDVTRGPCRCGAFH